MLPVAPFHNEKRQSCDDIKPHGDRKHAQVALVNGYLATVGCRH